MEVFEMMKKIWGIDQFIAFCQMNMFKYRMRAGVKPGVDAATDLAKADEYKRLAEEARPTYPRMSKEQAHAELTGSIYSLEHEAGDPDYMLTIRKNKKGFFVHDMWSKHEMENIDPDSVKLKSDLAKKLGLEGQAYITDGIIKQKKK